MSELNKNIEIIIPGKLTAVKYSYIPFIGEIEYTADDEVPAYSEPLRITDQGVFLVNKDHPAHVFLEATLKKVISLSCKQLQRQYVKLASAKHKTSHDELYMLCLEAEQERRKKAK